MFKCDRKVIQTFSAISLKFYYVNRFFYGILNPCFFPSPNIQDENATNRPVCAFVNPLRAGRLLDTPRQAARFVSVMGYEQASAVGGGQPREQWSSMHAFLCKNKGVGLNEFF